MISKTPTRKGRTLAMVAATALVGTALASPALMASATDVTVALPKSIVKVDKPGYTQDTFTLPVVTGVKWKYDATTTATPVEGSTTAINAFGSTAPTGDAQGKVKITVTPVAQTGYTLPATPASYELVFAVAKVKTAVKPPTLVVNKTSGLATQVIIPNVKGVTYKLGGTEVTYAQAGKPEKKDVSGVSSTVTAELAADYESVGVTPTQWVLSHKTTAAEITIADEDKPTKVDGPGTSNDYALIKGVEGVTWTVAGKDYKVKPGATVKVKPAKNTTSITVTPKAANDGFTIQNADAITLDGFTARTDTPVTVAADGLRVTITGNSAVKSWKFGKTNIAVPVGTRLTVTVPAAGDLVATPAAGYSISSKDAADAAQGTTEATTGIWTLPLAAAAATGA